MARPECYPKQTIFPIEVAPLARSASRKHLIRLDGPGHDIAQGQYSL